MRKTSFTLILTLILALSVVSTSYSRIAYHKIELIGGGANSLDNVDGAVLNGNDFAFVHLPGNIQYNYILNATSGAAEIAPFVISPDANAGTKRWLLLTPYVVYADATLADQGAASGDGYRSVKDLVDAAGARQVTIILPNSTGDTTTYTLTTSETIPLTVKLEREHGAILDGAGTLTINGPFEADLSQCFGSSISVIFGAGAVEKILPQWWGAKGDYSTDDATAIQACFTSAGASDTGYFYPLVYFPVCAGYATQSAVTCASHVNIEMDAPIVYMGVGEITILTVGDATFNENARLRLQAIRNIQSDWTNEANIGIKIIRPYSSRIEIERAEKCTIGVQFYANGSSGWNRTMLGRLYRNKIGVDLTDSGAGWFNENTFYDGKFSNSTAVNNGTDRYGIRITSGYAYEQQRNAFYRPSFELGADPPNHYAYPLLIVHGSQNHFYDCRSDGNSETMTCQNASRWNYATCAATTVLNQGTYTDNFVYDSREQSKNDPGIKIFDSGNLHKRACRYDATKINVPGVSLVTGGSMGTPNADNIWIEENYLDLHTRGIGRWLNTERVKNFVFRADRDSGNAGGIALRCYDSSGNVLTSGGGNHPYVKGSGLPSWGYTASWGGAYANSGAGYDSFATFHADVKKVLVMFTNCSIKSFGFFVARGEEPNVKYADTWNEYEEIVPGCNIGTASPTKGRYDDAGYIAGWPVGKLLYDATPVSGAPLGWICIRNEDTLANGGEPATETVWAVDDEQNAAVGDIIGVVLDDDTVHWDDIAGVAAGQITVTNGVPGGRTIPDNAEIVWFKFNALANLA